MRRQLGVVVVLGASLAVAACDDDGPAPQAPGSTAPASVTPPRVRGLEATSNDQQVVALAHEALGCTWKKSGFKYDCAKLKAWKESPRIKNGQADRTLVSMLEDEREQVRWLGAQALSNRGKLYRSDPDQARRVVEAAKAETSEAIAPALGTTVGRIDATKTGMQGAMEQIIRSHPLGPMRRSMVSSVLFDNHGFYDTLMKLARQEPDAEVRRAAVSAFWMGTQANKRDESCALWLDRVQHDEDDSIAGEAAYLCAFYKADGGCERHWDDLLGAIESKAKAGAVRSAQSAAALGYFHKQKNASGEQKKRALAIARALAQNADNDGRARARALEFIGDGDPRGRAFVSTFENDEDDFVKRRAEQLVSKK